MFAGNSIVVGNLIVDSSMIDSLTAVLDKMVDTLAEMSFVAVAKTDNMCSVVDMD